MIYRIVNLTNLATILAVAISLMLGTATAIRNNQKNDDQKKPPTVKRVKRPDTAAQNSEPYFTDLFEQALEGERPDPVALKLARQKLLAASKQLEPGDDKKWSQFIDRDAIEDEIKSINLGLESLIQSPSQFDNSFGDVREQFSVLSMLFAIISEYDREIRWKKYSLTAQNLFAEAATKSRTPSRPGFELAVIRRRDLEELVRGGGIEVDDQRPKTIEWPNVIDRSTIMNRLEKILNTELKPGVSNDSEFEKQQTSMINHANLVTAFAQVLIQDNMDEADDDGYRDFSNAMGRAGRQLITAANNKDIDGVRFAVNQIEQSCNDCHAEWR